MEKSTIMVYVPLEEYEQGVVARARIGAMERFTAESKYSIAKEDLAAILGFELPEAREGGPNCVPGDM